MKNLAFKTTGRIPPRFLANFDSASAMVRSTGQFLQGRGFPGLQLAPPSEPLAAAVNALPKQIRETMYVWSGFGEAIPADRTGDIRAEELSKWIVNHYPDRQYPSVAIGSSSGAMVHLYAALGIPWLPQTLLIPVRQTDVHPDDPKEGLEKGLEPGRRLLEANPELQLHHMFDPNQDRLMLERMTYFRVKRRLLGETYERFLEERLEPGGTILLAECQRTFPTVEVEPRHIFQFGALGGATPEEFIHGSERVEKYLDQYNSHRRTWDAPEPDGDRPEAEWGYEPALTADIERIARERGYKIKRVVFDEPEHPSPLIAELYRWWYRQRGFDANRLFVESFVAHEPYWTLRTGSVPFWMKFNMEPSAEWIEQYLDTADPYDEIYLTLFSHGVEAVGFVPIERWREVIARAKKGGDFIGVEEDKYPHDFGVFARYHKEIREKIPARYPLPGPLTLEQLEGYLESSGGSPLVQWIDHPVHESVSAG